MSIDEKLFSFEFASGVSAETHRKYLTLADVAKMLQNPGTHKREKSYIAGELEGHYRNHENVINRSMLTLDLDGAQECGFKALRASLSGFYYLWHTTYSHSEEKPSYRVLVPLAEPVTPGQYTEIVRRIVSTYPEASIDPSCTKPEQVMFTPASENVFIYDYGVQEGALADKSLWVPGNPSALEVAVPLARADRKADPYTVRGIVGKFNRAYPDLDELIHEFELPYTFDSATGRYRYDGSSPDSTPGMRELDDRPGLYYSWHAKDPAAGYAQNAFDLVRIHKFGHLDAEYEQEKATALAGEKDPKKRAAVSRKYVAANAPSYKACRDFLDYNEDFSTRVSDLSRRGIASNITAAYIQQEQNTPPGTPSDSHELVASETIDLGWVKKLQLDAKTQLPVDSLKNICLIMENDPNVADIWKCDRGNFIAMSPAEMWMEYPNPEREEAHDDYTDDLRDVLETVYGLKVTVERAEQAIRKQAKKKVLDPVKEYLDSLVWDGQKRLDTCLPGVEEHTEYTRMVARKSLLAAIARVYHPGIGADQTLILVGRERRGKSEWISRMCKGMEVSLGDIKQKDSLMLAHRAWIVVSNEAGALNQADFDDLKDFMTTKKDSYRAPYARQPREYRRRWVIWGSTNEAEFLREREGNRRFLLVECTGRLDFDLFTPGYVDQIWAEAMHAYNQGETHRLSDYEEALAAKERVKYTRSDSWTEMIEELLRVPVPKNWEKVRLSERSRRVRQYEESITETLGSTSSPAEKPREFITPLEAWVEVLGGTPKDLSRQDHGRLSDAMAALVSRGILRREPKKRHIPGQGQQFIYHINHDVLEIN